MTKTAGTWYSCAVCSSQAVRMLGIHWSSGNVLLSCSLHLSPDDSDSNGDSDISEVDIVTSHVTNIASDVAAETSKLVLTSYKCVLQHFLQHSLLFWVIGNESELVFHSKLRTVCIIPDTFYTYIVF